jgi:carbon storage regulator CsrA
MKVMDIKVGDAIKIGDDVTVRILEKRNYAEFRVGIDAPLCIAVSRPEVISRKSTNMSEEVIGKTQITYKKRRLKTPLMISNKV